MKAFINFFLFVNTLKKSIVFERYALHVYPLINIKKHRGFILYGFY